MVQQYAHKYILFLKGISVHWIGKLGIVLTTSSFITFILLEIPTSTGIITNVYVGIINYMILPFIFVLGLLLIPLGWWQFKRKTGKTTRELLEHRFGDELIATGHFGSKLLFTISALTLLNVAFMGLSSVGAMKFMDQPNFCGTACHSVMNPEWVTYQQSPHARVKCVECHVGEGVSALVKSKFNGAWQIVSLAFNLYERPIPTPVHQLRPARETCEKCHWPEKFYGSRMKTIVRYGEDILSTPLYSTLDLKVDTGKGVGQSGIHWHIGKGNSIKYSSVADKREEITWVEYERSGQGVVRYTNKRLSEAGMSTIQEEESDEESIRVMDCVDCHNRATHIYEYPDQAIDERLAKGLLDVSLPFIKREALRAITANYPSSDAAMAGIDTHIRGFYRRYFVDSAARRLDAIDQAITVLQDIYSRNIHHNMNITWNSYPNHIGHRKDGGCFRCHNSYMKDEKGNNIRHQCTLCHSMLAYQSKEPFQFLRPIEKKGKESALHRFLKEEFLDSRR